ncbi:MAG: prepilin-type N-terminal cleavage/methylation domain-containing protein [Candidatus Saccharibacteria bacterium]|nr:prepilin-type N-terminal cleavage/methylation domain-containing protein [Candidatus Saccharibacteria bacterium]
MRRQVKHKRGDTLIEVMLSISIFALVAMITINMMNDGINTAQRTLEAEMARNEIDAQAEALRFIHNSYVSERQESESQSQFRKVWSKLISNASIPSLTATTAADVDPGASFDINNMNSCEEAYQNGAHLERFKAFVLNTRLIVPEFSTNSNFSYLGLKYSDKTTSSEDNLMNHMIVYYSKGGTKSGKFSAPSLYPRIIFGKLSGNNLAGHKTNDDNTALDEGSDIFNDVAMAEGIWINAVSNIDKNITSSKGADYYDFYIRTCWHAAGRRVPSTITTVVRLYNPEVMQ